ncbi:MAG: HPr(Ser) kinase/phosphatase [Acholeplasmatales bacterium]|jgi:HPr kinase/phosphorylase|nr:HPr(Ser) kinase/phosphatase [Acholeplasmatales bacterium]
MEKNILVKELHSDLKLDILSGKKGVDRLILSEMVDRPGLELFGYFDYFSDHRVLLIGSKEYSFLKTFPKEDVLIKMEDLLKKEPPVIVFSKNVDVPKKFLELSNKYNIPFLKSNIDSTPLTSLLHTYLHKRLAPIQAYHGVLVNIQGVGVLITGPSGIGKSEVALELIKRGHTLVSDDRIDLIEESYGNIIGTTPKLLKGLIEVRGVGIIDVVRMFGTSAYTVSHKVDLVVVLEAMQKDKKYDRIGLLKEYEQIFNTQIPKITIPVSSGRSIASLVETAALNQKLKNLGYNAGEDLVRNVEEEIKKKVK